MQNYKLLSSNVVSDIWCKRKARGFDPLDGKEILILLKYFSRRWDDPSCFSLLAGGIFPLTREEAERMIEYYYENKKLYHKGGRNIPSCFYLKGGESDGRIAKKRETFYRRNRETK